MDWSLALLLFSLASGVAPGRSKVEAAPDAGADKAARAQAESLIEEGVRLREEGRDGEALDRFRKAWTVARSPRALAQVALAEQALGRWLDAEGHLREAVAAERDPWIAKNRKALLQSLRSIESHLGWIELLGGEPGALVNVNGRGVGTLPLQHPLRIEAGAAVIAIEAPGRHPWSRTVDVRGGATVRETVTLLLITPSTQVPPVAAAVARSPLPPPPQSEIAEPAAAPVRGWPAQRKVALGLAVGAGASLVTGALFHLSWQTAVHKFEENPACGTSVTGYGGPDCQSQYDTGHRAATFAIIGYVGALVLGGSSAYLFSTSKAELPDARASVSRVGCTVALPTGGLACGGRF